MHITSCVRRLQQVVPDYLVEGRDATDDEREEAIEEIISILAELTNLLDNAANKRTLSATIMRECQHRVGTLIDTMPMKRMLIKVPEDEYQEFYDTCKDIYIYLETFLVDCSQSYPDHFDFEYPIPDNCCRMYWHHLRDDVMIIEGWMRHGENYEEYKEVADIILELFSRVQPAHDPHLSFDGITFIVDMKELLKALWVEYGEHVNEGQLSDSLICLNLNSPEFINYYCDCITKERYAHKELPKQLEVLLMIQERVKAIPTHPNLCFDSSEPPPKEMILVWLEIQIEQLIEEIG